MRGIQLIQENNEKHPELIQKEDCDAHQIFLHLYYLFIIFIFLLRLTVEFVVFDKWWSKMVCQKRSQMREEMGQMDQLKFVEHSL